MKVLTEFLFCCEKNHLIKSLTSCFYVDSISLLLAEAHVLGCFALRLELGIWTIRSSFWFALLSEKPKKLS